MKKAKWYSLPALPTLLIVIAGTVLLVLAFTRKNTLSVLTVPVDAAKADGIMRQISMTARARAKLRWKAFMRIHLLFLQGTRALYYKIIKKSIRKYHEI